MPRGWLQELPTTPCEVPGLLAGGVVAAVLARPAARRNRRHELVKLLGLRSICHELSVPLSFGGKHVASVLTPSYPLALRAPAQSSPSTKGSKYLLSRYRCPLLTRKKPFAEGTWKPTGRIQFAEITISSQGKPSSGVLLSCMAFFGPLLATSWDTPRNATHNDGFFLGILPQYCNQPQTSGNDMLCLIGYSQYLGKRRCSVRVHI